MKKNKILSAIISATILSAAALSFNAIADTAPVDFSKLTPAQQDQIGKIASDYIVKNPQVLIDASKTLREQQMKANQEAMVKSAQNAISNAQDILNDPNAPTIGPKDAKVALVTFTDYNCMYCAKASPEIQAIVKANPNVKFVFKELPILASNFPVSTYAAQVGLEVNKEKGSEAYFKYHEGIYATGHDEGSLTKEDVDTVAKSVGVTPKISATEFEDQIKANEDLAQKLNIRGTPGFVIMKTENPTAEKTVVVPGFINQSQIQSLIDDTSK